MKHIKYIYILLLFIGVTSMISGCKEYFDLNENPNFVQAPPLNSLLSTVTHKTGIFSRNMANIVNNYSQYIASPVESSALDTYEITDQTSQWDSVYRAMSDIYDMQVLARSVNSTEHLGVANVLMAYNLGLITDIFGAAPYSQAFGGSVLNPVYDGEEALYNECLNLLNEAIDLLNQDNSAVVLGVNQDLIHGGNRLAWLKTANAIKARFLNKVSKKSIYDPNAVLSALDNAYTSNADDAGMGVFQGNNPWAQVAISNANALLGGWLSDNFVNHLNGTTYGVFDPRIEQITDRTIHGVFKGTRNGQGNLGPAANTVRDESYISVNSPWTSEESPLWIVTYAETKFIEAEAAFRTNDIPRAYQAYLDGIAANMNKLQVPQAAAQEYINNPVVSVGANALTLNLIFKEKYVTTYLNAEAWNDVRRHDYQYENFRMPMNAQLDTFIRRMAYPVGEISKNGTNVPAEVPLSTNLWWDRP
ncbi:SusD/RagB family nutrient-binding outer membrane lipoprotein [Anditalea andensis]|uniref:SusD/RagB family nutrient-binding outer membrane lipoprotein n=1 Tax=Anditalea andensis TaxID=1048983 RepID=A0A074KU26_9BACT|nr:SusD/RagB family nutrient-binding outer membrane lipoprotein [Anditalea andensis]KEO72419.1 hypothetical protein EL17_16885 [Anditalea andensis]